MWVDHPEHALVGGNGSPDFVQIIDGKFFDKYIAEPGTGKWLAGDTIWIICSGIRHPDKVLNEAATNICKGMYYLNDEFYKGNDTIRFGLVDAMQEELLVSALQNNPERPMVRAHMLRDGRVYIPALNKVGYNWVYELIEENWSHPDVEALSYKL